MKEFSPISVNHPILPLVETNLFPSHLEQGGFDPQIFCDVKDAIALRRQGRYQESIAHFLGLPQDVLEQPAVRNEHALSYVFQHNFEGLLELTGCLDGTQDDTKEAAFATLLTDYARMHADLMLSEAVMTAGEVQTKWLVERPVESYDDLDVYMACFCHIIQEIGRRMLSVDESFVQESFTLGPLSSLRRHLLDAGRVHEVLIIQFTGCELYSAAELIPELLEALTYCAAPTPAETVSLRRDIAAWHHVLLAEALVTDNRAAEYPDQLEIAHNIFKQSVNHEGCLWVQYYSVTLAEGEVGEAQLQTLGELMDKFKDFGDWRGMQRCMFAIMEAYQKARQKVLCRSALFSLLHTTVGTLPRSDQFWSSDVSADAYQGHADISIPTRRNQGSMFCFWQRYMSHLMPDDVNDTQNIGTALELYSQLFAIHPRCSIPQLQYLFASTLCDLYGSGVGDARMALYWAYKALQYAIMAKDAESEAEAQSQFRILLAGDNVKIVDDPHGSSQRDWEVAKVQDLKILLEEAGEKGHWKEQLAYANKLLQMQLTTEVNMKTEISGEPWLSMAKSLIQRLSESQRRDERYRTDYTMAHAIFESGDCDRAITALTQLIEDCKREPAKDLDLALHAPFTLGRAHLRAFKDSKDEAQWDACRQVLETTARSAMKLDRPDVTACCHVILADLWRAREMDDQTVAAKALHHISEAETLWGQERRSLWNLDGLDGLLTRYSLRHRNEATPSDVFAIAYDACFGGKDFEGAWRWVQKAKARAFIDSIRGTEERTYSASRESSMSMISDQQSRNGIGIDLPALDTLSEEPEGVVCVDWVTADDTIYMLTIRVGEKPLMHKLDIDLPTVRQWYSDLRDAQEDRFDADDAADILAELDALCAPLADPVVSRPGELLILCPTKLLFKVPLHALNVGGDVLLARNPIVYTYALSVLEQCSMAARRTSETRKSLPIALFGNPTEDTPGGTESVADLCEFMHAEGLIADKATRARFIAACCSSSLVHFHGHVVVDEHPLNHNMLFHGGAELKARDVSALDLHQTSPLVCLIGCGSGVERFGTGDEPLGLISAFIYAGASGVLATLWPIHDTLSGKPFSSVFYEDFRVGARVENDQRWVIDMAKSLQKAALAIREKENTRAPYYWAGFVLHGHWSFRV